MANYVLDTGVLIGYVRGAPYAAYVEKKFSPSTAPNLATISTVSIGELYSFALRRNWGPTKQAGLATLLRSIPATPVAHQTILQKFSEIDAFNHRQHPSLPLPVSGHTMGDNDIWVAATASVLNANLLTTDHDFDHLNGIFVNVFYIDQKLSPADA